MTDDLRQRLLDLAEHAATGRDIAMAQDAFRDTLMGRGWSQDDASRFVTVIHTPEKMAIITTYHAVETAKQLLEAALDQINSGRYTLEQETIGTTKGN